MANWEDVSSNSNDGWEDVKWEDVPEEKGLLDTIIEGGKQFGKNVGGAALGAADIAAGAVTALPAMGAGAVQRAFGVPAEDVRKNIQEAMSTGTISNLVSKMGLGDPRENQSYQYMMKPFEAIQQGVEKGVEALGGGEEEKLLADIATVAAPIPFAGKIGRAVGRGLEAVDPALRSLESETRTGTRERMGLDQGWEDVSPTPEPRMVESTDRNVTVRYPESDANLGQQGDLFETMNPYDVAGYVTEALEGRERTIGEAPQGDLFANMEDTSVQTPRTYAEATPTPSGKPGEIRIVEQDWAPQPEMEVPPQFAKVVEDIPVLRDIVPEASRPTEPPLATERVKAPIEQITKDVPGFGKEMERYIFDNADPDTIINRALQEKDASNFLEKTSRYATSGANLASLTRRSSLVKGVYSYWNQAENTFRKAWNTKVIPVEKSLAHLSRVERTELANLMRDEMFARERNTDAVNRLSKRTQESYEKLRQALQDAGEAFNRGRAANGQPPVSVHDYYMASRWRGNYKMEVRDREGNLVWFLREPSQRALNRSAEALKKADPQLVFKEIEPGWRGTKADQLEAGYLDMLKLLDENDPRVQALKSVYEEHIAQEGAPALGMPFHAENKANVRGFIGDRPQRTSTQNAVELLNSQIQYMKNTYKWAAQMEANAKVKKVLSDPRLQEAQPNNVAYARDYSKNALGFGTDQNIRNLETALSRGFGFDREQAMNGLNWLRSYFYTKNLGLLNPKAMAVQMIQPIFTLPAQLDLHASGFKYDPLTHALDTFRDVNSLWGKGEMRPDTKAALDYATENGILSINVLEDVRNIGESALSQKAKKYANINQVKAEEFGRTMAYLSMINHFRQSGLQGETLYRSAEAAVNRIMTDYRKFEQPMWMQKGGMATHAVGTLKTFLNNILNQYVLYGKEAVNGIKNGNYAKVAPFAAMLGLQYALAGVMGLPGAETITSLYDDYILPMMGPKYADKSAKGALVQSLSDNQLNGPLSDWLNVNLHGSLSQGQLAGGGSLGEIAMPFMSDIAKTVAATGKAVINPSERNVAGAVYENLPPHLKGAMESLYPGFTSETGVSLNPRDTDKGMYRRSEYERALRFLGATSNVETTTKSRAYEAQKQEMRINEAKGELRKGYIDAVRTGNTDRMKEVVQTLSRWMGPDEIANYLTQGMQETMKNRNQDVIRRMLPNNLESVSAIQKYNRVREMSGR